MYAMIVQIIINGRVVVVALTWKCIQKAHHHPPFLCQLGFVDGWIIMFHFVTKFCRA
jgi:hypothetical protein